MTADPTRREHQPTSATPGGVVPRIGARLIDAIIIAAVGVLAGLATNFGFVWLTLQAVLVFVYFVGLDVAWGTTIGKRALGLRVTGPDGRPPTVQQAAIREAFTLLGAIPFAGPVLALIAWIVIIATVASSSTGQGKHDELAGGTRVLTA
jgi:uncharacterized RDD family membrane protein YckC